MAKKATNRKAQNKKPRNRTDANSYNLQNERLQLALAPKGYTTSEAQRTLRQDFNQKKGRYKNRSGRRYRVYDRGPYDRA